MMLADQLILQQVADEERARLLRYKAAWEAYHGRMPAPLRATKTDPKGDDNVIIAYGALVVDTIVSWLFGEEPTFDLDSDQERSEPEQWLDAVWQANRKMLLLQKLATNGAVCGHVFVKITEASSLTAPYPRLIILDPANVSITWSDEDIDDVLRYRIQWNTIDRQTAKPAVRRQIVERQNQRWVITDEVSEPNSSRFRQIGQAVWRWPWAPVVDSQHIPVPNEYYGRSELEDLVLAVNKAINFGFSNNNRIQRLHGHPKTVGTGFRAQEMDVSVDQVVVLPNKDATLRNLEMASNMEANFAQLDRLVDALLKLARIPPLAFGDVRNVPELSGAALAIYFQPLVQKIGSLRLTYGHMISELNRRLLDVGGFGAENAVHNQWPELLPRDLMQERQAALIDQQLGVSQDTILSRLGYDPAIERQRREANTADLGEKLLTAFERGQ